MKRLNLIASLLFGITACVASVEQPKPADPIDPPGDVVPPDDTMACYDTGLGIKCVLKRQMPAGTEAVCSDHDGDTRASDSSNSGPSPSDDDTSDSSDGPKRPGCGSEDSSESNDDDSGNSDSDTKDEGCDVPDGDADGDGVPNDQDCDCACPDNPDPTQPKQQCGNGVVEGNEQCDDGNLNPFDGCDTCILVDITPDKRNPGYQPISTLQR
jgi:cysteine-rich repeat protein